MSQLEVVSEGCSLSNDTGIRHLRLDNNNKNSTTFFPEERGETYTTVEPTPFSWYIPPLFVTTEKTLS